MTIDIEKVNDICIAALKGRLDVITSAELDGALDGLISSGAKKVLFDLRELDYISSAGLRSLLSAAKKLKAVDGRIALSSLNSNVSEVFKISGLSAFFDIRDSKDDALSVLA